MIRDGIMYTQLYIYIYNVYIRIAYICIVCCVFRILFLNTFKRTNFHQFVTHTHIICVCTCLHYVHQRQRIVWTNESVFHSFIHKICFIFFFLFHPWFKYMYIIFICNSALLRLMWTRMIERNRSQYMYNVVWNRIKSRDFIFIAHIALYITLYIYTWEIKIRPDTLIIIVVILNK